VSGSAKGRRAYERRAWADAFEAFAAASTLAAADVERLAWSAVLTGHHEASLEAFERLYTLRLEASENLPAARAAFWLALRLTSVGQQARAAGWLSRAQRLVDREGDCVERGYLRLPHAMRSSTPEAATEAAEIGDRFHDPDLSALARTFQGRALIRQGRFAEGLPLLDEAMLSVSNGELSPTVTGLIYCMVIAACRQSYALDRAREWTSALTGWCEAQPQLVAFAGACLIHRSEILQLGGDWTGALEEAQRASVHLSKLHDADTGDAFYQEGELHRVRGQWADAELAYTHAREHGRDPQPGHALLRLAEGRVDQAAAAIRRVLSATADPLQRGRILPAHVEIMLAASDTSEARRASDELTSLAKRLDMEVLTATALQARGSVQLAEGDPSAALPVLRQALEVWLRLKAPHPLARLRVVVARAYRALGDDDGAALELESAKKVFAELEAQPDLAAIAALLTPAAVPRSAAPSGHGLSTRELEVLGLVASGKTNKVIAKELFLSEKTIDRHVSNIFTKLDVPSRAAATAWAFRNGIVG
jgi:DNA-binding CsgD family transcriptional regulator